MPDSPARPRVGFIGTGLIGTPMVQRLLECGLSVTVCGGLVYDVDELLSDVRAMVDESWQGATDERPPGP